jgi:hypothetical protein
VTQQQYVEEAIQMYNKVIEMGSAFSGVEAQLQLVLQAAEMLIQCYHRMNDVNNSMQYLCLYQSYMVHKTHLKYFIANCREADVEKLYINAATHVSDWKCCNTHNHSIHDYLLTSPAWNRCAVKPSFEEVVKSLPKVIFDEGMSLKLLRIFCF